MEPGVEATSFFDPSNFVFPFGTHVAVVEVNPDTGKTTLRRYVHLSTGNYNAVTARTYTDLDLITSDDDLTADAAQLLNLLTGYSVAGMQELIEQKDSTLRWRKMVVAPMDFGILSINRHHFIGSKACDQIQFRTCRGCNRQMGCAIQFQQLS